MRLRLLENLPAMLNDFRELWGLIYQIIKLTATGNQYWLLW